MRDTQILIKRKDFSFTYTPIQALLFEYQQQREQENENPVCEIQFKIGQNMCGLKIICESIFWLINDIKVYLT